jgi:hypothetical protein
MALEQLGTLLQQMQEDGLISVDESQEVLDQALEFEKRHSELFAHYQGQVVLMAGGELFAAPTLEAAAKAAHQHFPAKCFYAEVLAEKGHLSEGEAWS